MRVSVDLGFRSFVLVACVLVLLIGFLFARHKWRAAAAKGEEIKRLLALAAAEAARAELEVTSGYCYDNNNNEDVVSKAALPEKRDSYCAVCYSPATKLCGKCKAVRYCSGKCQIAHWRQGHKENCHPAPVVDLHDERSDEEPKVTKKNLEFNAKKIEAGQSAEKFFEEPVTVDPGCPSEVQCVKDDDSEDENIADRKEIESPSGASAASFSGFSTSASGSGSSDDVSVSGSVSSFELDREDANQSVNDSLDMLQNSFSMGHIDQSRPLSPKFASSADSVERTSSNGENEAKPSCSNGENEQISNSSSGVNHNGRSKGPATKSCTASSDFWGRTLDSFEPEIDNNVSPKSPTTVPVHKGDSESIGSTLEDALPEASGHKSVYGADLLEKTNGDVSKFRNSPSHTSGPRSNSVTFNSRGTTSVTIPDSYGDKSFSSEIVSSKDAFHSSRVVPTSTERSVHIVKNSSGKLKHREVDCRSSTISDASLSSGGRGPSTVKSGNTRSFEASDIVSTEFTRSSNDKTGSKTSVFKVFDQIRGSKISKHDPLRVGSETADKHAEKELFPYDVFVKLYSWNKVGLRPSGLLNCGNSCYANAVLQCLAFTPPLTAYLLQGLHSKSCTKKVWCFMCEFEILILKAKEGKSPLSPIGILSQLRKIGSQIGNGRQEDAHEFLRYAIDTMQYVCLLESGVIGSKSLMEDTTLIGLTFGGYLRSKIKCSRCQGKSERQERMMDLTVEIEGDIATLEEALRRFTGTEILDGENKYQCSRCKSYEKAKKKLTILEAPNILTIALKRFQSGKFGKINKTVRFPEILDLAPYMSSSSDKLPIYKLYGVVVHLDVMSAAFSGHYVCYVKNLHNKWFKVDDSTVTAVDIENVLAKEAYLLLYSRCSARAPRLVRNKIISSDPKHRALPSWISGKSTDSKSKSFSSHPPDNSTRYPPSQRILEEDSSIDNSSLISSHSDEGSSSTDSTCYSTSTDDFPDYLFGDRGHGWNSPWRNSSDAGYSTSSSSSPSSLKHSPLSDSNRYESSAGETRSSWDSRPLEDSCRFADSDGKVSSPFLNSDITKQCRNLANSSISSFYRETESVRVGRDSVSNVNLRSSYCDRTSN